ARKKSGQNRTRSEGVAMNLEPSNLLVWTFNVYVQGLCGHLLLPLLAVGVLLVLWGWLGRGFGLPYLFWHARPLGQCLAGLAVGLLFTQLGFIGFLLDLRERDPRPDAMPFPVLTTPGGEFEVTAESEPETGELRLQVQKFGPDGNAMEKYALPLDHMLRERV